MHASEEYIKRVVKNNSVVGLDCTWDEIKDLKIRFCYKCYLGRMKAFKRDQTSKVLWNVLVRVLW